MISSPSWSPKSTCPSCCRACPSGWACWWPAPTACAPTARPAYNATVQAAPLAGLLWVEEIKQFLLARGLAGASALRQREVAHYLRTAGTVPLSALADYVRERLMARLPERLLLREERRAERVRVAGIRARRKGRR